MTRQKILSLLLALALLAGAGAPAQCAGQPTLVCDTGEEKGVISLRLEELDGSAVYGVQVELVLSGEYPQYIFTPSSQTAYSPDCTVEITPQGDAAVTIYLTSRAALNQGSTLDLGELDLGTSGLVGWDALPETASVILLDQQLRPVSSALPVTPTAPAGTDHRPPAAGHRPSATPSQPEDADPQLPSDPVLPTAMPFTDVPAGEWYYSAVAYVYAHSIMSGTAANIFSPSENTTRGMIVTMLHRLEGSPAALPASFLDVPDGEYYAGPVAWASANGIVTGIGDGLFAPDAPITREQLAAILYRYAQYKGLDTAARADLGTFPDAASVSPYAAAPMSWAVGVGLVAGSDGRLDPGGNAIRAQVAVIFQRLCANLLEMS